MFVLLYLALLFPDDRLCSIRAEFVGPTPERAIILAVALSQNAEVTGHTTLAGTFGSPDTIVRATGYRFRVLDIAGGDTGLRPGSTFLVVPWKYDPSCAPTPWGSDRWVPVGTEVVFTLSQGRPIARKEVVFDVRGWHAPYPNGEFLKYSARSSSPSDRSEWLTASEYFNLVSALPRLVSFPSTGTWRSEVERLFREGNPKWAVTFPGSEILQNARRDPLPARAF